MPRLTRRAPRATAAKPAQPAPPAPAGAGSLLGLPECHAMLPEVSRTFALTIPQLPEPLRDEVCIAYLICRAADTIEDSEQLDKGTRSRLFRFLKQAVRRPVGTEGWKVWSALWPGVAHAGYDRLMSQLPLVLSAFWALPARTRSAIRSCVSEMIDGMARYAAAPEGAATRRVCRDLDQLENYCHYVAATVGGLLTRLFHPAFGGEAEAPGSRLLERGRRFGLALQMTNVLKDYPRDLERGVAYLPPGTLEQKDGEWRLVPAGLSDFLGRVVGHLDEAQCFILWIPPRHRGTRLFCLWALHLAIRTLVRAASLDPTVSPKVPRSELAEILAQAEAAAVDDAALEALYAGYRAELLRRIGALCGEGGALEPASRSG